METYKHIPHLSFSERPGGTSITPNITNTNAHDSPEPTGRAEDVPEVIMHLVRTAQIADTDFEANKTAEFPH